MNPLASSLFAKNAITPIAVPLQMIDRFLGSFTISIVFMHSFLKAFARGAALATGMGRLMEVSKMLSIVKHGLRT